MAFNPPCMFEDGNNATSIFTNLETGDTATVCPDHLVAFCLSIVEQLTGVNMGEVLEAAQNAAEQNAPHPEDEDPEDLEDEDTDSDGYDELSPEDDSDDTEPVD